LFADLAIRADTDNYQGPAVLPNYGRVILDEAHHIEDIATEYFANELSWIDLLRTLARIASERHEQGKLPLLKAKLEESHRKVPEAAIAALLMKIKVDFTVMRKEVLQASSDAFKALQSFLPRTEEIIAGEQKLRLLAEHHRHPLWTESVVPKAKLLIESTQRYAHALNALENDLKSLKNERLQEQTKGIRFDLSALALRLHTAAALFDQFINSEPPANKVRWIETHLLKTMTNVNVVDADLDVSQALVDFLFKPFPTVVLCSATLTTNRQFGYVKQRLGLTAEQLPGKFVSQNIYESPFDYKKQAVFITPSDMPSPLETSFLPAATEAIWQAVQTSRGAAFVLFTSYTMLKQCSESIALKMQQGGYTLLKQGDDTRQTLLKSFVNTSKAVLFGTDSFWEGVDVSGEALRCVIIVKLPFRVPTEPIIQARTEAITAQGKDPFFGYSLPNAIVKFKQGFGRLIRNKKDRGCIVCLDSRILTKNYGKQFLNSLPECQQLCIPMAQLPEQMRAFYKRTHYLTFT
jgi:ATP-dependent DNA helicase DinG